MKIKDYIKLNSINREDKDYELQILKFFNIDTSKLTVKEVKDKVKEINKIEPTKIEKPKIKINNKWFMVEKDLTKSTFSQFLMLESYLIDENFFINHLNEVLSIYVRPRVFNWLKLKWEIEPWDENKKKKTADLLLEMDINDAFGLNLFFYLNAKNSIKSMKIHYLNKRMESLNQTMK